MDIDNITFDYFEELRKDISENMIEELACIWWKNYHSNPAKCLEDLSLCLVNSGGLAVTSINLETLPNASPLRDIFNEAAIITHPAIFDKTFCKKFKVFLDCILRKDSWNIFDNILKLEPVLRLIKHLKLSPLNSIRAVAYITGLRIMTQAWRCYFYFKKSTIFIEQVRTKTANDIWGITFKDIFVYNFRDRVAHLRAIPLFELIKWFEEQNTFLMKNSFLKYIPRSLKDRSWGNKSIAIQLVHAIFLEPIIIKQQQILFELIKPDLFNLFFARDSKVPVYCLRTINNAGRNLDWMVEGHLQQDKNQNARLILSKFLRLGLNLSEEKLIFMTLYDRRTSVTREAIYYFDSIYLKNVWNAVSILKIVDVYRNCPVKSHIIVIKHFLKYFACKITWQDWKEALIHCTHENICDCLAFFSEFVHIVMNRGTIFEDKEIPKYLVDLKLKETFLVQFETSWLNLMSLDRIKTQPRALFLLLKVLHLFYNSSQPNNIKEELASTELKIFVEHQDYIILKECIHGFDLLQDISTDYMKEYTRKVISDYIDFACKTIANQTTTAAALSLIRLKVVLLLKCFYLETELLWEYLIFSLESYKESEKVEDIVIILYNIIMNERRYYVEYQISNKINSIKLLKTEEPLYFITLRLSNRFSVFSKVLYSILKDPGSLSLSYVAVKAFGELLQHFGKHVAKEPILKDLVYEVNDEELMMFVKYCSSFMLIDCPQPKNVCCSILNLCVKLMNSGKMSPLVLKYFIQHVGKVHLHSVNILQTLENIAKNPIAAMSIVNGLILFYNEWKNIVTVETLQSQLKSKLEFILLYKALPRNDHQFLCVHMYHYVKNIINQGYTVFSGVWNIIKGSLMAEILETLEKK